MRIFGKNELTFFFLKFSRSPLKSMVIIVTVILSIYGFIGMIADLLTGLTLLGYLILVIICIAVFLPLVSKLLVPLVYKEYKVWSRQTVIDILTRTLLEIDSKGSSRITHQQVGMFLETPEKELFPMTLHCDKEQSLDDLEFRAWNFSPQKIEKITPTVYKVFLKPDKTIIPFLPFKLKFCWKLPDKFGKEFDVVSSPIINSTGKHKVEVKSEIPIEFAVSFKDSEKFPDKRELIAIKAIHLKDTKCPLVEIHNPHNLSWEIVNPDIGVYRTVFFYQGCKKKFLNRT